MVFVESVDDTFVEGTKRERNLLVVLQRKNVNCNGPMAIYLAKKKVNRIGNWFLLSSYHFFNNIFGFLFNNNDVVFTV